MEDLRMAYRSTKLRKYGVTFLQAIESPMFRMALTHLAEIAYKKAAGNPAPKQPDK
ncbi:hypothetical protein LG204_10155 [Methylovorus menthalis]|uniref:hypothetical protein n=1 Tax=Methylovorus menthalis TaxID=1002227 RepID=UPI001E5CF0EC|nr:hypothetical protein [Methylovorus menthalis]MCB4811677.1 hypothetical protein [Methylovorus menthalis]